MKRFAAPVVAAALLAGLLWLIISHPPPQISPRKVAAAGQDETFAPSIGGVGEPLATWDPLAAVGQRPEPSTPQATPSASPSLAPGSPRRRPWDPQFLSSLRTAAPGDPFRFELVAGESASGALQQVERRNGEVMRIAGRLSEPEAGQFFFQRQTQPGVAGEFVGVVEFAGSKLAYRLEPTGPGGAPELVEKPLTGVVCLRLPWPDAAAAGQTAEIPPLKPDNFPTVPIPDYQNGIIVLESLAGATAVIYLDFQGGYTSTWGGIAYDRPSISNASIRDVWERVAEDYMPFNINVTTDLRVFQRAPENSRQRVAITPTTTAAPGAGGVAYIGSFNWTGDTPCWVFIVGGKACAEACSHEAGHTVGLSHDGQDAPGIPHNEYYGGQGSGDTGWAPIMGVGYYQNVSQWSRGEYTNANNSQDDIAIISSQNNNVAYRADDTGDTLANSRYLEISASGGARAEGVIERTADTDAFQFTTTGGAVTLRVDPVGSGPNLALQATLYDSSDTLLASNNAQNVLYASISTNLGAGTYTFRVTGAGRNNPVTDGFSAYASLGYYAVTGSIAQARQPSRFAIPENKASGTLVGVVAANNPNSDPLAYTITSGNTGNTFALDSAGNLSVANGALLDYEALARNTQLAVQFEMFVDIIDSTDSTFTELNRRVVVAVTNVNESPSVTGFNATVLEHTQPGTTIGQVTGSDPDFYTLLAYSIGGGNSNGMFAIDSHSGIISLAGDLNTATQNVYNLSVVVSDQTPPSPLTATSTVTVVVLTNNTPYRPGSISYAVYTNIAGNTISALTSAASYPNDPALEKQLTLFEGDSNRGVNYGAVIRGYLIPPVSGSYTFWIATDDNGELWLSSSTNAAAITRIAGIATDGNYAGPREWTKYASQQSSAVSLVAGKAYYIEGRLKQGGGGDNIAVAWQCAAAGIARDVIPGQFLAPYFLNYVPHLTGFVYNLHRDAFAKSRLGTVQVTDLNSNDGHFFSIAANNLFSVDAATGVIRLTNELNLQTTAKTNYTLQVRAVDTGTPRRSNTTSITITVVPTNAITTRLAQQEMWNNIGSGTAVANLTSQPTFPRRPDSLLPLTAFDSGQGLGDNYGSRIRAYLTPTNSGSYTFFIASDDNSQLKFSATTNPATATPIASVSDYTDYQQWTKFASQKSAAISLSAGQSYYLEALQKEGGGGDHVEVAWAGPGLSGTNPIVGSFLTPVDLNFPPLLSSLTVPVPITVTNGATVTNLAALDSSLDTLTYKIVSGNLSNLFALDPDTGTLTVADNTAIATYLVSSVTLLVQVQDSGYGGLYPLRTSQASVTVQVTDNSPALVWSGGAADANWSSAANWLGALPAANSKLRFAGLNQQTNFNDLLTQAGPVSFSNGGFFLAGNPLLLLAGITSAGDNTWGISSILNKPQTFSSLSGTLFIGSAVNNNGNLLTLRANSSIEVDAPISGAGGLIKSGPGNLIITSANSYAGPTTIAAGSLILAGSGSIASSSSIEVQAGATLLAEADGGLTVPPLLALSGNGLVGGNAVIYGALQPGASVGSLTFSNALTLAGSALLEISKSGSTLTNDSVVVLDTLTCGGSLTVTNLGEPLASGDSFKLFSALSIQGSFVSLGLPPLGPGLIWDTSQLTANGTLQVASLTSPQARFEVINGTNLAMRAQSWLNVTYVLEATPSLAPPAWTGLSTNLGTGTPLVLLVPIDLTQSNRFFRLRAYTP